MAGIYIHIPFCKQACHYCNFHFSTNLKTISELTECIGKEIAIRKDELPTKNIDSIYLGGGTPSLLGTNELGKIFSALRTHFTWNGSIEITLEANPDDISNERLLLWKQNGINRLSIGIQSFFPEDLIKMNRAHNEEMAMNSILLSRDFGFENLSIDLIFGLPWSNLNRWKQNVEKCIQLRPEHVSCYGLTIEPKTAFDYFIRAQKMNSINEEQFAEEFQYASQTLENVGYTHYEISNYALQGKQAIHNSNYWNRQEYLGFGPAAHSFVGNKRKWNVSDNRLYIKNIKGGELFSNDEILTPQDQLNEFIMTSLRQANGILKKDLLQFEESLVSTLINEMNKITNKHKFVETHNAFKIKKEYWLQADRIISDLFVVH